MSKVIICNTDGAVPSGTDLVGYDLGVNSRDGKVYVQAGIAGTMLNENTQTFKGKKEFEEAPTTPNGVVRLADITGVQYIGEDLK